MEVSEFYLPVPMCLNDFRLRAQPIRAPPDGCSRAQRPLATGGGTKDNQESSIVDIGTKKIHVISYIYT